MCVCVYTHALHYAELEERIAENSEILVLNLAVYIGLARTRI
jgi:hypothetical protein